MKLHYCIIAMLAAASAVFSAAPSMGYDAYTAGVTFVAILSVLVVLFAALGSRAAVPAAYQAAE